MCNYVLLYYFMHAIKSYQADIAAKLASISNDAMETYLTRSLFGLPLRSVVSALTDTADTAAPVLTSNALRRQLEPEMTSEQSWEICAAFVTQTVAKINTLSPSKYAESEMNLTRNNYGKTDREAATAMCCYGSFSSNPFDCTADAAMYALDHHAYAYGFGKPRAALQGKSVTTFALENTFQIGFTYNSPYDLVYPGLFFNSQIRGAIFGYDLSIYRDLGRCTARNILLLPSTNADGTVAVHQHKIAKNKRKFAHAIPKPPDEYILIGTITNTLSDGIEVDLPEPLASVVHSLYEQD